MKKNKLVAICALASFGLTGCDIGGLFGGGKHTHNYDFPEYQTLEEATCIRRGTKVRTCLDCGYQDEVPIPADPDNGHKWVKDSKSDKEATCKTTGITGSKVCKWCREEQPGTEVPISEHDLQYMVPQPSDAKYKAATCTESGLGAYECTLCHEVIDQELKCEGHKDDEVIEKNGLVSKMKCRECGEFTGYYLDIESASGWNKYDKMSSKIAPDNEAVWDITDGKIPEGSYDIQFFGHLPSQRTQFEKKYYNMSVEDLMVDGDAEINAKASEVDSDEEADYRYFVKINGKDEFYPQSKKTFEELGFFGEDRNGWKDNNIDFVEGVKIDSSVKTISLFHDNINTSLICRGIRLVPHTHDGDVTKIIGQNSKTTYTIEKCKCGYRKITIEATDGDFGLDGSGQKMANKSGTPEGYIKLSSNNDFISYNFSTDENIVGTMYMVGRQDSYPQNASQNPYNCKWENCGEQIEFADATKTCGTFFGNAADSTFAKSGYSPEGSVIVGDVELPKDKDISLKYTRSGSYNIALNKVVIEGRIVRHLHNFVRDSSKDITPNCTSKGKEAYVCGCGETKFVESKNAIGHSYTISTVVVPPTCTSEGKMTMKCSRCGDPSPTEISIPRTHSMQMIDTTDDSYILQGCNTCGERYAEWTLTDSMIKDKVGDEYITSTTVKKMSGLCSNGINNMNVYRFDTVNRKVTLNFYNDGEAVTAKLKMLATTKCDDISKCQPYQQTLIGDNSYKFAVTVNGTPVTFKNITTSMTIGDLGLKNVASKVVDGSALADPTWLDFCDVSLKAGQNTIEFEVPCETLYSMYIGGFALSYVA